MGLRRAIASGGTMPFEGYGDLSLTELLPAILTRYSETELLIAAPSLPEQATDVIARWMDRQWARMDGRGRLWCVGHLTVVTDVTLSPAVAEWVGRDAWRGRLSVVDTVQDDTSILLPDFAVTGPVNMQYNAYFVAEATTEKGKIEALWEKFLPKAQPAAQDTPDMQEQPAGEKPTDETPVEQPAEEKPRQKGSQKKRKDAE